MPPLVLLTAALFVYAHLVVIDTEMIDVRVGGADDPVLHLNVFDFATRNAVKMMWNSGAWPLALLVVSFSVCWVYIKLALMLIVWLAPLSHVATSRLLFVLDMLGKWSFIDLFVALLYQGGLSLQLTQILQVGGASIGLHTRKGAYVFVTALVLAIAMTNAMVLLHRRTSTSAEEQESTRVVAFGATERLGALRAHSAADVPSTLVASPRSTPLLVLLGASATVAALSCWTLYAALQPTFQFTYGGVFCRYLPPAKRVAEQSLWSLMVGLNDADFVDATEGYRKDHFIWLIVGVGLLVALLAQIALAPMLIAALLCPARSVQVPACLACARTALGLRSGPTRQGAQLLPDVVRADYAYTEERGGGARGADECARALVYGEERCATASRSAGVRLKVWALHGSQLVSAWAATDVFCLSIGVACAEMNTIATYTLTQQPADVLEIMQAFCGDAACLTVHTQLLAGFWQLVAAVVLTQICSAAVMVGARREIAAQLAAENTAPRAQTSRTQPAGLVGTVVTKLETY